jgi:hypothetical protein
MQSSLIDLLVLLCIDGVEDKGSRQEREWWSMTKVHVPSRGEAS